MSYAPTLIVPPVDEPITLAEGKLRAGLDWPDGDPRDVLMRGFIAAARGMVERRTELALLEQTRDVPVDPGCGTTIWLRTLALQAVVAITTVDGAGTPQTLDPAQYVVADGARGRIDLVPAWAWSWSARPSAWLVRVVVGYPTPAALLAAEPLLVHAVGLLTAHYATLGRDLASTEAATEVPQGFEDAIASYLPVVVA